MRINSQYKRITALHSPKVPNLALKQSLDEIYRAAYYKTIMGWSSLLPKISIIHCLACGEPRNFLV